MNRRNDGLMSVPEKKVEAYFATTREALSMAKKHTIGQEGERIVDAAERYVSDAEHFREDGDLDTAFAALNYAHGWLDCGARLGFLDVSDTELFAVDP